MGDELPIDCSLLPVQLEQRLDEMAAVGDHALVDVRRSRTQAELRFAAGADVRTRVERLATAEAACCPFFAMDLRDEPDIVVLAIDAPDGAEQVLDELVAAFAPGAAK